MMRRFPFAMLSLALIAAGAGASAQQAPPPQISINVDTQPIVAGEPFTLQISVETQGENDPKIALPRLGGFRVLKQYESHPSSFQFSFGFGGRATNISKKESNYSFVLMAEKPGQYKLDPVMVTVDGRKYRGEAYRLDVVNGSGALQGGSSLTPVDPGGNEPVTEESPTESVVQDLDGAKVDPNFFLQTAVSKKEVVVGEMLTMTIYLYMARQISNYEIAREPGTEGFWGENLIPGNQRRLSSDQVTVGGRGYDRVALRKMALFPIKAGALTIQPTLVTLEVQPGGFFSRPKTVKRASLPVEVTVLDLPAEEQPKDFNPANVGRYSFRASLDNRDVKVGAPVTLTMVVKGSGNLRNLVLPPFEEMAGIKSYAPETEVDVKPEGDEVSGTLTSRVLMIPEEPGEYTIKEIAWSYFDPAARAYKTVSSKPLHFRVSGTGTHSEAPTADATAAGTVTKAGQDRLNRRLTSILSSADLDARGAGHPVTRPWFFLPAFGVPLIYLALVMASRTRRRMREARLKNRSRYADAESLRRLGLLTKQQADISSEEFYKELAACLIGFIESRLEEKALGDTMSELRERLVDRKVEAGLADKVVAELESCDFARFARSAEPAEERRRAIERTESLIRALARVQITRKKKEPK